MLRLLGLVFAFTTVGGTQQAQTSNPEDARRQDVYAIYSILMSNPPTGFAWDINSLYAIAAVTSPAFPFPRNSSPCIVPPVGYEARWNELLEEFNARKNIPATLTRELKIEKPYILLTEEEIARIGVLPSADPKLPGAKLLFHLSDVYFDRQRTIAVTGISTSHCGGRCSYGTWKIYGRRADGTWSELIPRSGCDWIE